MNKNVIAGLCTVAVALVIAIPFGLQAQVPVSAPVNSQAASQIVAPATPNLVAPDNGDADEAPVSDVVSADVDDDAADSGEGVSYVSGEALVVFNDEAAADPDAALAALRAETGIDGLEIAEMDPSFVKISIPGDMATDEAIARISTASVIDAAQPNFLYYVADDGSDPADLITPRASFDLQAGTFVLNTQSADGLISDVEKEGDNAWHLKQINAFTEGEGTGAWDVVKNHNYVNPNDATVRNRVVVAVIDNCFNVNHEDLRENIVAATSVTDVVPSRIWDTTNVASPDHGTHVAGIVAAQVNNEKGAAGVSYNAQVMPIRIADASGRMDSADLVEAYDYLLQKKADGVNVRVVNISLGGASSDLDVDDRQLFNKIDEAYAKDIVTVAAACNADSSHSVPYAAFPADFDRCVTVISLDKNDNRMSNSNYNRPGEKNKDIAAPGSQIYSTLMRSSSAYGLESGTSMAAPIVSGTLALMFAKDSNLTAEEAVSRLYSTADDINTTGWDEQTGYGRVNALKAVSDTGSASLVGDSEIAVGETVIFTPHTADSVDSWTWSTSNSAVASVDSSGNVRGVKGGTAIITAKATVGAVQYTAAQTVTVYDPTITSGTSSFTISNGSATMTYGSTVNLKVPDGQPDGGWEWTSSDTSIVSTGKASGNITARKASATPVTITVTLKSKPSIKSSITVRVNPASISNATVTLSPASYVYDGTDKKPTPVVRLSGKTLTYGTDYVVSYRNNRNVGTATCTVTGIGNYAGTRSVTYTIASQATTDKNKAHRVQYRTHVQNDGWQGYVRDGAIAGTSGRSLRLEGINISLVDKPYSGGIQYRTHVQNLGWQGWVSNGAMAGTSGRSLRLEAIQIQLTGDMANHYDVYYRVHCQNIGWMGWAKNGAQAGTAGFSYRLEAIQIKLVEKGGAAPGSMANAFRDPTSSVSGVPDSESKVLYRTHVQNVGWQNYMRDGESSGTSGRSLRLEGINIKLGGAVGYSGGIKYRTHVQNLGWQGWKYNGSMSGTSGQSLRLEAIQIDLTGIAKEHYDIYYRVHCQNIGWMGWAKNGTQAGTAGYSYRLEAIQIKLVPKGGAAPGSTSGAFRQR